MYNNNIIHNRDHHDIFDNLYMNKHKNLSIYYKITLRM